MTAQKIIKLIFIYHTISNGFLFAMYSTETMTDFSEGVDETEEVEETQIDNNVILVDEKALKKDLSSSNTARYQIDYNLKLTKYKDYDQFLQQSILCIGSGHDTKNIEKYHKFPTILRCKIDIGIDRKSCIQPDIVGDGFNIETLNNTDIANKKFGIVFFAHATLGIPTHTLAFEALNRYFLILMDGGFFILNTEVFNKTYLESLAYNHICGNSNELKELWREKLVKCGFEYIEIVLKDEPQYGNNENSVSFLIIARKPG